MNYTKGEWKPVKIKNAWFVVSEQQGKTAEICRTFDLESGDAQLISASPDLYEALKDMGKVLYKFIGMIHEETKDGERNLKMIRDAMNKCTKALDKAEAK